MYQQPQYQPAHYQPPATHRRPQMTGLSITALVLGSVALALSPVPFLNNAGAICGILAIIMGLVAVFRSWRWMPVFGILLGTIGFIITLVLQAQWARELDEFQRDLDQIGTELEADIDQYQDCLDSYGDDTGRAMLECDQ